MDAVHVSRSDFNEILNTAETLVGEVERVLEGDELVSKRLEEIKTGKVKGITEKELNNYLRKRGVEVV